MINGRVPSPPLHTRAAIVVVGPDGPDPPSSTCSGQTYNQPVPGDTVAQQFAVVSRWIGQDQRDGREMAAIAWGNQSHSAMEQAAGTSASNQDWPQRLEDALTASATCASRSTTSTRKTRRQSRAAGRERTA